MDRSKGGATSFCVSGSVVWPRFPYEPPSWRPLPRGADFSAPTLGSGQVRDHGADRNGVGGVGPTRGLHLTDVSCHYAPPAFAAQPGPRVTHPRGKGRAVQLGLHGPEEPRHADVPICEDPE